MSEMDRYDFELPKQLIAQHPRSNRTDARLMLVDRRSGTIEHAHIRDLPEQLVAGDSLVLNNSRVIPAKMVGFRMTTRGRWQGLFLSEDPQTGVWEVLAKTRGKLVPGERIMIEDRHGREGMTLECVMKTEQGHWLVKPEQPGSPVDLLQRYGRVPLPPYIRDGQMVDADLEDYQTVFAKRPGSVAAPTAGLHFTEPLLHRLAAAGIGISAVTLHVGIGTFRPIKAESLDDHRMHSEWGELSQPTCDAALAARAAGHRIVAVGSTSVRVLESAALANGGQLAPWQGETDLFIRPGHRFAGCDAILTNFHLPRSSLLVMMSAFTGETLLRQAYQEAIQQEYRFFSYGDAMLIT